jgi:hypothetical protein
MLGVMHERLDKSLESFSDRDITVFIELLEGIRPTTLLQQLHKELAMRAALRAAGALVAPALAQREAPSNCRSQLIEAQHLGHSGV